MSHEPVTSPSSRTLELLGLLQTGRWWSVADLATRLDTGPRSVRRDVARLRSLGYGVQSRPGPGGGYRLDSGVTIPPLVLDADEVTTLVTALLVLEGADLEGATHGATDAAVVRAKLERLLPGSLRRRAIATATHVLTSGLEPVDMHLHGLLVDTAAERGIVRFTYSDGDDCVSGRQVQPLTCFIREGRWYLLGHDMHRHDWRVFRLDRITSATADPAVTGRPPLGFPDESLEGWLTSDFGRRPLPADHPPRGSSATSRGDDGSASAAQDGG